MDRVLCYIETIDGEEDIWEQDNWLEKMARVQEKIMPLIDHPHNDVENGQREVHYHADTRYIDKSLKDQYAQSMRIDLPLKANARLEYRMLKKTGDYPQYITSVDLISKSKLKHKCIHKGKCPHRGYDLSNEEPKNNVITCPLHGLKFSSETKQLI